VMSKLKPEVCGAWPPPYVGAGPQPPPEAGFGCCCCCW
jgi:hypothetical protein